MRVPNWKPILFLAVFSLCLFVSTPQAAGQTITSLSPTVGAVGASVTIAGSGFGATQVTSTVTFNGTAATAASWSADAIEVPVPSGATTGNVVVTVSGVASNGVSFTVVPAPSINSLSVTSGVVGASVTITGTNFDATQGTGTVSFNGTDATPTSWSATSIVVTVPAEATTGNVVVSASGVASNGINFTVLEGLGITSVSPTSGVVGTEVAITGIGFGSTQGSSTISLNGTTAVVASWSDTSIITFVPSGASTGPFTVTANGNPTSSSSFTVTPLPFGWSDGDIGSVGLAGSATYANGLFTVKGAGQGIGTGTTSDAINLAYQSLSGNGTIVARVVSLQGSSAQAGVMIRETLNAGATDGYTFFWNTSSSLLFDYRATTGGSTTGTGQGSLSLPYWMELIRSGNSFSAYRSTDGVNWTQTGSTQTITMASSVYIGLAVSSQSTSALTDSLGNPTGYIAEVIGGEWLPVSSTGSGCSSCTMRGTIQLTYDSRGNVLTKTNELGATTTYTYDSNNNVTSVSVPIAPDTFATTMYTYNSFGEVLTTTDPMGNVTTNTYDANGNLLTVTTPKPNGSTAASVTQFAYNSLGELTQITDPLNNLTKLTYYSTGLIDTITDAQQNVTTYAYDTHGNRTSVTDALQNQTTFAYDAGDRLKTITYPGSTGTTTFIYDIRGRRTSVTDQNGKTTTYAYDDADRLTSVTDAASPGNVTTYGYDTEDNLTSIQDANNHTTTFAYDAFGRVTKTTFPSTLSEYYYYDAVGNLIQKTDRKNQTVTYTYDQLNRLLQKGYPDSTAVNYTYDNDSRLTQVTDPTGTYQFTFDNMGRLTQAATQYTFLTGRNFTTSYSYDAASNRTGFTDPENGSTSYAYDTLNRLQTLTPPTAFGGSGNFGFSYDALSRRTQMTRPNGLKSVYAYDNLSRLLSVLHQSGSTTLDGASYTVDNAGNRTAKTDQYANVTSNYTYDPIYELTQVTQGTNTTESYTYDPVGNRLSSLGVSPYSVTVSNELTSTPSTTYTYDNNGNTLTEVVGSNTTTYAWDFENRLTSVTLPGSGGTVSFAYDPFGRRIKKVTSATTSVFAYDGDNLVEETNSSGAVVARYEDTQNIDEPLAMLRSSATSYFHADGLGSITSLSSAAGSIANTYTYDSFGKLTASTGSLVNPFQYTARESDSETGLYYYRARYYDPIVGRFTREDPRKEVVRGLNFYAYVRNSPPNLTDPDGRDPCGWLCRMWNWFKFGKEKYKSANDAIDWTLCGVYYVNCLDTGMGIKRDLAQAMSTADPVTYATLVAELAQQTGANSMSQLNLNVCFKNDDNCKKALECAKKGLTNPLPGF